MSLRTVWRQVRGSLSERPYNILVVSDLHLGCELKAGGPSAAGAARRAELDRQLAGFIDWHADHRTEGRPWRLILNGDIVDFVAITLTPAPGEAVPFQVSEEEQRCGLAPEEAKCVWKLRRTAECHGEVFDALARFLLSGHSVHVVRGNHDAEFHWPAVQAEWRTILNDRAGASGALARKLEAELEFHAWFYLEPGFFYAEHGNAHDRYSLQSGFFEPVTAAHQGLEMALPLSSQLLRYFINLYGQTDGMDDADTWGVVDFMRWVGRMGNPLRIAADYFMMMFRVLYPIARHSMRLSRKVARSAARAMDRNLGGDDERLLGVREMLGRFVGASEHQVRKLLAVASRPVEQSLFDSAQMFYLDRMLLALASLVISVVSVVSAPGLVCKLLALGGVGIGFSVLNAILARTRKTDAHPLLLQAARRVAEIFDVRYVTMGHSHRTVSQPVSAGAHYFNTGSWTNARAAEGFPHVCVEGPQAELRRWKGPPAQVPALTPAAETGHAQDRAPGAMAVPA